MRRGERSEHSKMNDEKPSSPQRSSDRRPSDHSKTERSPAAKEEPSGSTSEVAERREAPATGCSPASGFGVRSYLHHFYESRIKWDPQRFEEGDDSYHYLLPSRRRGRCSAKWWKLGLAIGFSLMLVGMILLLVGYLVPVRSVVVAVRDHYQVIDRWALHFNQQLDLCKLFGLICFCLGGGLLAFCLLAPSIMCRECLHDEEQEAPIRIYVHDDTENETTAPFFGNVLQVKRQQPQRKDEAVVTQAGLVDIAKRP